MHQKIGFTNFSLFVSLVAALGGLLFGYNTSVISGALLFLTGEFALTTFQQELVVSTLLIGALVGALLGGMIADFFGRKKTLFFTLFLFLPFSTTFPTRSTFISCSLFRMSITLT